MLGLAAEKPPVSVGFVSWGHPEMATPSVTTLDTAGNWNQEVKGVAAAFRL